MSEQKEIIMKQAEEISQLKLTISELRQEIKNNAYEKQIKDLKHKIQELESRRFLVDCTDDDKDSVFQKRLIDLHIVDPRKIDQMILDKDFIHTDKNGKEFLCPIARRKWTTYKKILSCLGTLVAHAYHKFHGRRPNVASRTGRPNFYLLSDFESFGDTVIQRYFDAMSLEDRILYNQVKKFPHVPENPDTDSEVI